MDEFSSLLAFQINLVRRHVLYLPARCSAQQLSFQQDSREATSALFSKQQQDSICQLTANELQNVRLSVQLWHKISRTYITDNIRE